MARPLQLEKRSLVFAAWLLLGLACLAVPSASAAAATAADADALAAKARSDYLAARRQYHDAASSPAAAWRFGRACFELAEFARHRSERARLAREGIDASRKAVDDDPNSAAGHYYLAMNLGQLARTKWLGALRLVRHIEKEFSASRRLNEHFDHAGPDRNLGLLYRQAPSVISVGNRRKAREHLEQAVRLAPLYPENRLDLVEALCAWHRTEDARDQLHTLESNLPAMRKRFAGAQWAPDWQDWDAWLQRLQQRVRQC